MDYTASLLVILSNCVGTRREVTDATIELMASESRKQVTPVHRDQVLKGQRAQSPEDAEMYDIILGSIQFSFGFLYSYSALGLIGEVFRTVGQDLTQYFDKNEEAHREKLDTLMIALTEQIIANGYVGELPEEVTPPAEDETTAPSSPNDDPTTVWAYDYFEATKDNITVIDSTDDQGKNGQPAAWYNDTYAVGNTWIGDVVAINDVNFGSIGASSVAVRLSWGTEAGTMEIILDDLNNTPVAVVNIEPTSGFARDDAEDFTATFETPITSVHTVYCKFASGAPGSFFGIVFTESSK